MRAPVVIYYLVLLAFAGALIAGFWNLSASLEKRYAAVEEARRLEMEVAARNK